MYLGAAPGVGKTRAMLDEGHRRRSRGTDVVGGLIEARGRCDIEGLSAEFETVGAVGRVDVEALLTRHPAVVLIDDLAVEQRWRLVEVLLDAGIDVISTLSIEHLESLTDVVTKIIGGAPAYSIPDAVVRAADQIELVDMTPEAIRRRLAHGGIYPPEQVDVALANYFRLGNLAALRELALLWVADRVDEQLQLYIGAHGITDTWEIREKVVVALTGAGGAHLVRRAARIAGRVRGELVGVHVSTGRVSTGRASAREGRSVIELDLQRQLVGELGGTTREIVADDIAEALAKFAKTEQATQLVIGASHQTGLLGRRRSPVAAALMSQLGTVDIHVIAAEPSAEGDRRLFGPMSRRVPVPTHLSLAAWALCLVGLPLLTFILSRFRDQISVGGALLIDLALVVAVAVLGGLRPGLVAAVSAFGLTNWYLTAPLHTFAIGSSADVVAHAVFFAVTIAVTVVVAVLTDRVTRRSRDATRARFSAAAMARATATLVGADDPVGELIVQLQSTFGLAGASVLERSEGGWWPMVAVGPEELLDPSDGEAFALSADGNVQLVVSGAQLGPDQLDVLRAFGDQLAVALQGRKFRADAANSDLLAATDALRTALLQSVSHDLRTPLATIKASASGLLQHDVTFTRADRDALLVDIDDAADQLDRMIRNLLDMSRLQAGAFDMKSGPVALEEVVAAAVAGVPSGRSRTRISVSDTLPLIVADAALLERALANLISNALAWSPIDGVVRVEAALVDHQVHLRIIDRGPGVPTSERERMFLPFQRLGDRSFDAGAGLGLAIAKGFIDAIGGRLEADDTPGGGLTMSVTLTPEEEH